MCVISCYPLVSLLWLVCHQCGFPHADTHMHSRSTARGVRKKSLFITLHPTNSTPLHPIPTHHIPSQFHIIAFAHQRHVHWMYLYTGICPASCRCVCRAEKTFSRINFRIFRLACAWRFVYTALLGAKSGDSFI